MAPRAPSRATPQFKCSIPIDAIRMNKESYEGSGAVTRPRPGQVRRRIIERKKGEVSGSPGKFLLVCRTSCDHLAMQLRLGLGRVKAVVNLAASNAGFW
jgi:hypothetical protein